jgi:HD-like signal output (HDOD) protein
MGAVLDAPVFRCAGWEREADAARRVAVVTGELASATRDPHVDSGLAFLAGTLHEIGTLQILRHAPRDLSPHLLGRLIATLAPPLGHHLVAGWDLDARVAPLIGALADDEDADATRRAVRAAQIAAHVAVFGDAEELELAASRDVGERATELVAEARRIAREV